MIASAILAGSILAGKVWRGRPSTLQAELAGVVPGPSAPPIGCDGTSAITAEKALGKNAAATCAASDPRAICIKLHNDGN